MLGPPEDPQYLGDYLNTWGAGLRPETLVSVFRRMHARGEIRLCERVAILLMGRPEGDQVHGGHCEAIIRSVCGQMRLCGDRDERAEFRARCYSAMWLRILRTTERDFWEERFGLALRSLAIDVGRGMWRERRLLAGCNSESTGHEVADQSPGPDEIALSSCLTDELKQALHCLPEKESIALWLHYLEELPIESVDPDVHTVATTMGISGRMVRRYLRQGLDRLRGIVDDPRDGQNRQ